VSRPADSSERMRRSGLFERPAARHGSSVQSQMDIDTCYRP